MPDDAAPFCAGSRDVGAGRRAIEELDQVRCLAALRQQLEEGLEHPGAAEPPEPLPDAVPFAKLAGQRSPRYIVDREVVHGFEELAVVVPRFTPARLRRIKHFQHDCPIALRHPCQHVRLPVAGHAVIRTKPDSGIRQKCRSGIPSTRPNTDLPELIDMLGARFEMAASMGTGEADTVLFRTRMAPGKLVPLHSHHDPECFYVLDGGIEVFTVGPQQHWQALEVGRSLLVADGVRHAVRNLTDRVADLIVMTNGRLARFLSEAGRPAGVGTELSPPNADDLQRMVRVTEAYGYWMASPAESVAVTG